jgi:hypothetical protein
MQISKLNDDDLIDVIRLLPGDYLQARRMVEYLGQNPQTPTGRVAHHCGIGNLSDVARKLNPHIYGTGYFVGCERPPRPINNKFGEASNQFLWSIYELPEAANDSEY